MRTLVSKAVWLLVALYAFPVSGAATKVWHVAVKGNDSASGTAEAPLASIAVALKRAEGHAEPAEIVVHEGVYPGGDSVGTGKDRDVEGRPGLVIRAARREDGSFEEVILEGGLKIETAEAVLDKPGVYKMPGTFSYHRRPHIWESDTRTRYTLVADLAAVERYPASFWYSKSETFFHTSDGKPPSAHEMGRSLRVTGITVWRQNVTVRGLEFRNFLNWRYGCAVDLRTSKGTVEDCHAWNCVRGFTVSMEPPRDLRIARCRADDCGMGVYSHGTRTIVENCRFTKIRDAFMVPAYPQDDTGIQCYHPAFAGEIRRNVCVGFCNGIFLKCKDSRFVVEHNTCVDGITYGIGCTKWHPESVFRYNLVVGFSSPILMPSHLKPTTVMDYNCFWGAGKRALDRCVSEPRKIGAGAHNIAARPQFYAPTAGDFRLLPTSPGAAVGPDGETAGALGVVAAGAKDIEPPRVTVAAAEPAKRLEPPADRWLTPTRNVTLEVDAQDDLGKPTEMQIRLGDRAWGEAQALLPRMALNLPAGSPWTTVAVKVCDDAGNWSEPVSFALSVAADGPLLVAPPTVRANAHGVAVLFTTDVPCKAILEFGVDAQYGKTIEVPAHAQRWSDADQRVSHTVGLIEPLVEPNTKTHYRLVLEDALGNRTATADATLVLKGEPATHYVATTGEDGKRSGTRERPWRTLQFAVDRALPGDRIVLLPGLYAGETVMVQGGIEGAPVTIGAERAGTAILDSRHHDRTCLKLVGAAHVIIRGLEVRWFGRGDTFYSGDKAGIFLERSPHVTVADCRIWNDFWMGWPIGSGICARYSPGFVAERNVIYQMEQGIYLYFSPRSRITHNTILRNMYGAVKFFYSAEGTTSRNNSFCYSGNDQYVVLYRDKKELDTFDSDYNNVGTRLRRPDPGDEIVPDSPFFRHHGSKAVISLNGKRFNSLRAWQKETGKDLHSIFAEPKYVDPEHWDFRLKPDSPNIGAGEGGATIGALRVRKD